ncbi:MFS transporter [Desulfosporosinus fructosivorans]|uniref:Lysosomal dipeptide transporter MFSD1 n=1 Tax=Desulfosporosinus fructosivorans TaxID=2018669 RepID=A0A4Z0QXF0_9FIRM|nr:MFS transporter [Desulfosporosinus fructosivorans]TGE35110.1 MFS transporter [Desulfosporosinus fructosivorans]
MRKWTIFGVVYLALIVAIMSQFKVPPVMGVLMKEFHVNAVTAGWFMSVFSVMGIILAFPAAMILKRFGPKISGMVALSCTVLGSAVGAMAATSAVLLTGRVIEGTGLALLCVIAPSVIAMHFDRKEIGIPMGLLATWYPVGSTLAYNVSQPVVQAFGNWRGVWWFDATLALVALVLYAVVVTKPANAAVRHEQSGPKVPYFAGLKNARMWLLATTFLFLVMGRLGFMTWAPKYLADAFKVTAAQAASVSSLGFLSAAVGGILCSVIFNRVKNKNVLYLGFPIIALILYPIAYLLPYGLIPPWLIITGICTGFIGAANWAMIPNIVSSPIHIGLGMGVVSLMQGISNFSSPPIVGYFIAGNNWTRAVLPITVFCILALIVAIAFVKVNSKARQLKDEQQ